MNTIRIKEWKADQIDIEAKRFNTFCDVVYRVSENDVHYYKQEDGSVIYKVREVLKETEKAIYVHLESGLVDGSFKGWKTWVPKSAIIA